MAKISAAYKQAYAELNPEQKAAVDCLEGPLLVLAGPGTGKTQLLTTRVGQILANTDSSPENILCLTFSESAVTAMKQRLTNLIGPDYYEITVSTYHAFGKKLFDDHPEQFLKHPDDQPADELEIDRLVRKVQAGLPYANRLKPDYYVGDIKELISSYKRAMITPEQLDKLCTANEEFIAAATTVVNEALADMPKMSLKYLPAFESLLNSSDRLPTGATQPILPLKSLWEEELAVAVQQAQDTAKTGPLTKWKNRWLVKSGSGWSVLDPRMVLRQRDFVEVYNRYNQELKQAGRYDYDDMIIYAINGLVADPDLKASLQERYHYVQLDEFQDTNKAQLQLVELLLDNPVNENRPNVLAVGDDDQAIYSFQGAHYSNMERFYQLYDKVKLVALKTNYRSTPGIIELSAKVRDQIEDGLSLAEKAQVSANPKLKEDIRRVQLPLDSEALAWTAQSIAEEIDRGSDPGSIAVLAPKHDLLAELIPYLHAKNIALSYERRDNILEDAQINELLRAAELVLAIEEAQRADSLWPLVLSCDYWQLPTTLIWELSWQARSERSSWTEVLLNNKATRQIALFFIRLNQIANYTAFEQMLNYLLGTIPLTLNEADTQTLSSPFFSYYLNDLASPAAKIDAESWKLLGHLSILRAKAKASQNGILNLAQFVDFCLGYKNAGLKIVDSTPFRESQKAVNLMTAYSAKGQEYESVYLIDVVDNVWGKSSRGRNHLLSLPPNLSFIRLDRNSSDEKLRLLFVSLSRAKQRLILAGYSEALSGRKSEPLGFLAEQSKGGELISPLLPAGSQKIVSPPLSSLTLSVSSLAWFDRHLDTFSPEKRALLQNRLDNFALSSTNLNAFTNVIGGGPRQFFIDQILKFPAAQSLSATYGSAIHHTLDWEFKQMAANNGREPKLDQILKEFERDLSRRLLPKDDLSQLLERGKSALSAYFKLRPVAVGPLDQSEVGLSALTGEARMVGEIDRLLIDKQRRALTIIDFKTGRSYESWSNEIRPFHHKRQLYFYKALLERSNRFKGYNVEGALLQFVEPDADDGQVKQIRLQFDDTEADELNGLIAAVWQKVMSLDFDDTSGYPQDLKGIMQFEKLLLKS